MPTITVFSSEDLNSKALRSILQATGLPFNEISVVAHPSKLKDLLALTGTAAVPKVFFDTVPIGGLEETLYEIRRMNQKPVYKKSFLVSNTSPVNNSKLALPLEDGITTTTSLFVPARPPSIDLPDRTKTTYASITEKLKNSIPMKEVTVKGVFYMQVFSGIEASKTFKASMNLTDTEAIAFGNSLLFAKVIHSIGSKEKTKTFEANEKAFYRLQCFDTPDIINTYKIWDEPVERSCTDILDSLDGLLHNIETAAVDYNGMLDCTVAISHKEYPTFEEAICELQVVDIHGLTENERLAFGLNAYMLMLRYGFLKTGIPITEADRLHFLNNVKFNLGGDVFSFRQWLDGVLRGNNNSSIAKAPFSNKDSRRKLALSKLDHRIHFALNLGAVVGSTVSVPLRRYSADSIDKQLEMTSKVFFQDKHNLWSDSILGLVKLPKSLGIYRSDFGADDNELVSAISENLTGSQKTKLPSKNQKASVSFTDVNWARNATNFTRYDKDALVSRVKGIRAFMRLFQPAKMPEHEVARLAALRDLNILDTLAEERFDRITRMVQSHFAVPIAYVAFMDTNRQWYKSNQWSCPVPSFSEVPREVTFCGYTILQDDILVVNDALHDDRFADNPGVTGPLKIRFYAGCPLSVPGKDGQGSHNIGTLCLLDQRPREFSADDKRVLREFAEQTKVELLRRDSENKVTPASGQNAY